MSDKNCYVCQKNTLKKYICKDCYFKIVRENEELKKALRICNMFCAHSIKLDHLEKEFNND